MQDLIKQINESAKALKLDAVSFSEFYDKYAPALYGRIINVVKQREMAEKILERVFINALLDKNIKQPDHISLFTSLLNHYRKKSYGTLKAIRVLESLHCASEKSISVTG